MIKSLNVDTPLGRVRIQLHEYDLENNLGGNISAYMDNRELWNVSAVESGNSFVDFSFRDQNIEANTWDGFLYVIEPHTGIIKERYFVK